VVHDLNPAVGQLSVAPNPFNPLVQIKFTLPAAENIRVEIIGLDGRRVRILTDEYLNTGRHVFEWDGTDGTGRKVASGTYFCRLAGSSQSGQIRMVMLK